MQKMALVGPEQWEELDRDFDSEYYLLGNVTPVRVLIRKSSGLQSGAIAPDVETGELAWRTTLLSRLDASPEVEEISREEFDRLCGEIKKKIIPESGDNPGFAGPAPGIF